MIQKALEYLIKLGNVEMLNIGESVYSTQKLSLVQELTPAVLQVRSLTGLVEYLISSFDTDELSENKMVHVVSPTEVLVFSTFNRDFQRNEYIKASAMLPAFQFDRWYDSEDFNIKLQSAFVRNDDRDIMLQVVGNIKEDNVQTVSDDGISQAVVAKTGVATVGNVLVPNPVLLAPYRTFVEVDQPESEFIFRMKSGPSCALFEADGGAWKLKAMKNIKEFLHAALESEIQAGKIVIIA